MKNLEVFNKTIPGKWIWRFGVENAFWRGGKGGGSVKEAVAEKHGTIEGRW